MSGLKQVGDWIPPPYSFVCTGMQDTNNDGYCGRDELQGLGTYFECKKLGEVHPIIFGANWTNIKGRNISCRVKEKESGELVLIKDIGMMKTNDSLSFVGTTMRKKPEEYGINSYILEWYVDGQLIPTRTLEFFINTGEKETPQEQSKELEKEK